MLKLVSFLGLIGFLLICWLLSTNRRAVNKQTVIVGLGIQLTFGLVFLWWKAGKDFLYGVGSGVASFLGKSADGSIFMFGPLGVQEHAATILAIEGIPGDIAKGGFVFAFQVLPTIIFFSAFMAVIYHLGFMDWIVRGIAFVMVRTMKTSGSESLAVASNIFVGQTESPLLVRPFLKTMTNSELMAVMCGGFATIAGGVFALYVGFGIPAGHLIVASVMSAPAALVVAKVLVPETEESQTFGKVKFDIEKETSNVVEAAASGATDGLKLALNVGAMLIAFLGLIAVVNWGLSGLSSLFIAEDAAPWTLQMLLGYVFAPFAFLLGVGGDDLLKMGELLGYKVGVNELIAYDALSKLQPTVPPQPGQVSERTFTIATYALCGFANFSSIAIQIGGIAALVPERRRDLARLGLRAMFGGAVASWMTACIVGILL
ncbi:MAG: NupC/NupG family nucleoside CNT transporter [Planctomycetes bacterium]|nr:NupC/NupG family nucleoside CNT transporter [Planctomycetota bacterium]